MADPAIETDPDAGEYSVERIEDKRVINGKVRNDQAYFENIHKSHFFSRSFLDWILSKVEGLSS